jgi:twitching motility protein PilT
MQTLNAHLADLVRTHRITLDTALEHCTNREDVLTLTGSSVRRAPAAVGGLNAPLSL